MAAPADTVPSMNALSPSLAGEAAETPLSAALVPVPLVAAIPEAIGAIGASAVQNQIVLSEADIQRFQRFLDGAAIIPEFGSRNWERRKPGPAKDANDGERATGSRRSTRIGQNAKAMKEADMQKLEAELGNIIHRRGTPASSTSLDIRDHTGMFRSLASTWTPQELQMFFTLLWGFAYGIDDCMKRTYTRSKSVPYQQLHWDFSTLSDDRKLVHFGKTRADCTELYSVLSSIIDFQFVIDRGGYRLLSQRTTRPDANERGRYTSYLGTSRKATSAEDEVNADETNTNPQQYSANRRATSKRSKPEVSSSGDTTSDSSASTSDSERTDSDFKEESDDNSTPTLAPGESWNFDHMLAYLLQNHPYLPIENFPTFNSGHVVYYTAEEIEYNNKITKLLPEITSQEARISEEVEKTEKTERDVYTDSKKMARPLPTADEGSDERPRKRAKTSHTPDQAGETAPGKGHVAVCEKDGGKTNGNEPIAPLSFEECLAMRKNLERLLESHKELAGRQPKDFPSESDSVVFIDMLKRLVELQRSENLCWNPIFKNNKKIKILVRKVAELDTEKRDPIWGLFRYDAERLITAWKN